MVGGGHEIRRVLRALRRVERGLTVAGRSFSSGGLRVSGIDAASVRAMLAARRLRDERFGPEVGEVGWALLLEAFAAHLEGRGVAITGLGATAGIARSTAHRRAVQLLDRGFLVRLPAEGGRRAVGLSGDAAERVHACLAAALELGAPLL